MTIPDATLDLSWMVLSEALGPEGGDPSAEDDRVLLAHLRGVARLFRAAAHDLRSPLHAAVLHLELLRQSLNEPADPRLRARQEHYRSMIASEIQRLTNMLDAIWGATGGPASIEAFDVRETIRSLEAILVPYCRRNRLKLSVELPGAPLPIHATPEAARHALLDLLVQALPPAAPGGELLVAAAESGELVVVRVVPPAPVDGVPRLAARVLEPFGGRVHSSPGASVPYFEVEIPRAARDSTNSPPA